MNIIRFIIRPSLRFSSLKMLLWTIKPNMMQKDIAEQKTMA